MGFKTEARHDLASSTVDPWEAAMPEYEHGPTHAEHGTMDHLSMDHSADGGHSSTSWAMAAQATLHCLTGCTIGEVLGMVIGTALGFHNAGTVVLSIVLAFAFGYALTMRGVRSAGLDLRAAMKVALAADTVSILIMEIIDNTAMVAIPGALNAGLNTWLFWASLAGSLMLAFLITTPVNRAMISRGKGHAVVHAYHH